MTVRVINADVMDGLRQLPDESVHCVVTSPPYWGLRDYGVDGQIGLEETPQAFVDRMVDVFREVRRVLREDGTCWVNLGDSYANDGKWGGATSGKHVASLHGNTGIGRGKKTTGLKSKDLVGIPWRVALALQADGWWLRRDIIWHKPNPMPESATDRCTTAHEYLFHLTKSADYFYDADAVAEPRVSVGGAFVNGWATEGVHTPVAWSRDKGDAKSFRGGGKYTGNQSYDNSSPVDRETHGNKPAERKAGIDVPFGQ